MFFLCIYCFQKECKICKGIVYYIKNNSEFPLLKKQRHQLSNFQKFPQIKATKKITYRKITAVFLLLISN